METRSYPSPLPLAVPYPAGMSVPCAGRRELDGPLCPCSGIFGLQPRASCELIGTLLCTILTSCQSSPVLKSFLLFLFSFTDCPLITYTEFYSIRLGLFLRRYPIARLFVILYMVSMYFCRDVLHRSICAHARDPGLVIGSE